MGKTYETFKLADLYYMETHLRSNGRCDRLCIDPATGSLLLSVDCDWVEKSMASQTSGLNRFEWMGFVLSFGTTAQELIDRVGTGGGIGSLDPSLEEEEVTLDFLSMGRSDRTKHKFTSKSILCRMSQLIHIPVSLNPGGDCNTCLHQLIILETAQGLYLVEQLKNPPRRIPSDSDLEEDTHVQDVVSQWSQRPFQYSSAINPTVASIVIDLLYDLVQQNRSIEEERLILLDPTCGSGTFLALALQRGFDVVGQDINPLCVDGTIRNLEWVFGSEDEKYWVKWKNRWCVNVQNSAAVMEEDGSDGSIRRLDCAVANVPWGQNTVITDGDANMVR